MTYHGLLDADANGMGLWSLGDFAVVTTHPSDTTFAYFERLLSGEYGGGGRVGEDTADAKMLVVVNAFWSGKGENVGQPWVFGSCKRARELLSDERGDFEKIYAPTERSTSGWRGRCSGNGRDRGVCSMLTARASSANGTTNQVIASSPRRTTPPQASSRALGSIETPRTRLATTIASRESFVICLSSFVVVQYSTRYRRGDIMSRLEAVESG